MSDHSIDILLYYHLFATGPSEAVQMSSSHLPVTPRAPRRPSPASNSIHPKHASLCMLE